MNSETIQELNVDATVAASFGTDDTIMAPTEFESYSNTPAVQHYDVMLAGLAQFNRNITPAIIGC